MRIAVTYDNGNVFQHFGRTESFKIYEVQDGKVLYSEVVDSNGAGHGALAGVLDENAINVLICGGLGNGALNALTDVGIEVIAGAEGDTDAAVEAYLKGELVSTGVNCDHHGEEHACGGHGEAGGCGGSCGSCGGGCGGSYQPPFTGPNLNKLCQVHYRGTFNDGTQFDSSYDRGEPLEFICGSGMMIVGFDKAVATMEVGQIVYVHLMPEEAYGPLDPEAVITIPMENLPGSEDLNVGERVYLTNNMGQQFPVRVTDKTETDITFDANDEMAGKELNFQIELVSVR